MYTRFYFHVLTCRTISTVSKPTLILRCVLKGGEKKRNQQTGKNPFNFEVDGSRQLLYPYAQRPITNDDEFRADVVDTKIFPNDNNKENIPPQSPNIVNKYPTSSPNVSQRFFYAPTMANIKQFDKQFKLPKVKKQDKVLAEKAEIRQKTKENLTLRLAENEEKMKIINKGKNNSN